MRFREQYTASIAHLGCLSLVSTPSVLLLEAFPSEHFVRCCDVECKTNGHTIIPTESLRYSRILFAPTFWLCECSFWISRNVRARIINQPPTSEQTTEKYPALDFNYMESREEKAVSQRERVLLFFLLLLPGLRPMIFTLYSREQDAATIGKNVSDKAQRLFDALNKT